MVTMFAENEEFSRLVQEAGWTQEHTAQQLSLNRSSVNKIVNGRIRVSMTSLRLLSELTGGAIHLPGFTQGSKQLADGKIQYLATGWENDLIRECRQLTATQRNLLMETARQFVVSQTRSTEEPGGSKLEDSSNFDSKPLINSGDSPERGAHEAHKVPERPALSPKEKSVFRRIVGAKINAQRAGKTAQ